MLNGFPEMLYWLTLSEVGENTYTVTPSLSLGIYICNFCNCTEKVGILPFKNFAFIWSLVRLVFFFL